METIWVAIAELHLDPANLRKHPERNIEAIASCLRRFGQQKPIVIDGNNVVRAGNGTLLAAKRIPLEGLYCIRTELTGTDAVQYAIADNRTAELAEWEEEPLARTLQALQAECEDFDPNTIGFSGDELKDLLAGLGDVGPIGEQGDDPGPQTDKLEELKAKWQTAAGQLWLIESKSFPGGTHRLLCGDSTNEDDVRRLMNGLRARLMATDPPYLVNYQGGNHPQSWVNRPEVKDKHWDDYHEGDSPEFFTRFIRVALEHALVPNPAIYHWHASRRQVLVEQAWNENHLLVHQQIIWHKARAILTRSHYMWQHEPCFYGWVKGDLPELRPPNNATTVWEVDQQGECDGIHPTQKPVELFRRPMEYHTHVGDVCYEPFSGSGTSFVAAERTGRICHGMEISEGFVAGILERLAGLGLEPRLAVDAS